MSLLLERVVTTSQALQATTKRSSKRERLAKLLREAGPDAATCVSLLSGQPRQGKLGIGYRTLAANRPQGAAVQASLTLAELDLELTALAELRGKGSRAERARRLHALLSRATRDEQEFLIRLLTGELRQGALEAVLLDAVSLASGLSADELRRAWMYAGDLTEVARAALEGGRAALAGFRLSLFQPVRPMLAQTSGDLKEAVQRLGELSAEYKLDGARVQLHKRGDEVRIFSRRLNDVTDSLPELVEAARAADQKAFVLDAEAIALDTQGHPLPFQVTMRRFGRKLGVAEARQRLPVCLFAFDVLHLDGDDLADLDYRQRLDALDQLVPTTEAGPWRAVPRVVAPSPEEIRLFAEQAQRAGHEGVMLKALDSGYEAGRRGAAWLKLKPNHTLDLVVLAAEWGSGRRGGWLSNLHLGARDPKSGSFVMLGKTFKGLTDDMLRFQTAALQRLELSRDAHTVFVKPELVVEVAFDAVQTSSQYPVGVSLRFARVKRYRPDKTAEMADTIDRVLALHPSSRADVP